MDDLISRSALKEWLTRPTGFRANCEDCTDIDCLDCIIGEAIDNAPAVDAVVVVRCKDCKCGKYPDSMKLVGKYVNCALYDPMPLMRSDDFCSYGERRADE